MRKGIVVSLLALLQLGCTDTSAPHDPIATGSLAPVRDGEPARPSFDVVRRLAGTWQSVDDALLRVEIADGPSGPQFTEVLDGAQEPPEPLSFVVDCTSMAQASPASLTFAIPREEDELCYRVDEIADDRLVLLSQPTGERLRFHRAR